MHIYVYICIHASFSFVLMIAFMMGGDPAQGGHAGPAPPLGLWRGSSLGHCMGPSLEPWSGPSRGPWNHTAKKKIYIYVYIYIYILAGTCPIWTDSSHWI